MLFFLVLIIVYCTFNNITTRNNTYDDDNCETMSNLATDSGYAVKSYGYVNKDCDCDRHKLIRHMQNVDDFDFVPDRKWLSYNNLLPWWNSTRNTRNMSYDIRGDVPIDVQFIPTWYASPHINNNQ